MLPALRIRLPDAHSNPVRSRCAVIIGQWSFWLRILALTFAAPVVHAQSVRWDPASGSLARDQVSQLSLVFQDAEPKTTPVPPAVPGLTFEPGTNRSEQTMLNLMGGQSSRQRTIIYTYRVRPTRSDGEVRIPAFTVETNAGSLTVPAVGFTLATASVGQTGLTLDQIARAHLEVPASAVWAGEIIRLTHVLDVNQNYQYRANDALTWEKNLLVTEPWSDPKRERRANNGVPVVSESRVARAMAPQPGNYTMGPIQQETLIATDVDVFGRPVGSAFIISTPPATFTVRPLPLPRPADFDGAVGQFTLTGKVVPEKASVGEPVTWTLTLDGTGNWPVIDRLPPRELSRDFRVVSPRAQKTPRKDSLFDATLSEDLVLIPQKPGRTTLGPYTLSVFNPSTGRYETLRTEPVVIEITPAASPAPRIPGPQSQIPDETPASATPAPTPAPPEPVAKLPADPLPAGATASVPFANWPGALLWTLPVLLVPAALWLAFAARHARHHDPLRPHRDAHARLNQIIARLEIASGSASGASPPASDLLEWQHATRTLFDLDSATPSARDLPDPLWSALWIETERALYRPSTGLSTEWFAQAREAHARALPPPRSAFAALRPAHLFARVALWTLVLHSLLLTGHAAFAVEAREAYGAGDFPAAEKAWREAVSRAPLGWPVRHDLSLALAQQGKWDEAAAHAYAAALQAPRASETRRLLDVALPKASFHARQVPTPALLLSPRHWQLVAIAAAILLLLTPCAYLCSRYVPRSRSGPGSVIGHSSLVLSLVALAAAVLALRAYGPAAHPAAVLVWRAATLRAVPTDAGEQKVTSPLPAGTLARIDKTFLGWRRLVLPDGTTGWVRAEALAGLWSMP